MRYFVRPLDRAAPKATWEEVYLVYWWPDKQYEDYESLPAKFKSLVRRCRGSGSRYLVYANAFIPGVGEVYGYSRCMDIDNPEKDYGRNKAVGWLREKALKHGYAVVQAG